MTDAKDDTYLLRSDNFHSKLSAKFNESLIKGNFVDVTLVAEGHLIKAHRLVLSACSPCFQEMFTNMPANQHAFVFLKNVTIAALTDLIQFIYHGEVNVTQDSLQPLIQLAEELQINGLTESGDTQAPQPPPATSTPQTTYVPRKTVAATRENIVTSPRKRVVPLNLSQTQTYKWSSEDNTDKEPVLIQQIQKRVLQPSNWIPQTAQKRLKTTPATNIIPLVETEQTWQAQEQRTQWTQQQQQQQQAQQQAQQRQIVKMTKAYDNKLVGDLEYIDVPVDCFDENELEETDETEAILVENSYDDVQYVESYFMENYETTASGLAEQHTEGDESANESEYNKIGRLEPSKRGGFLLHYGGKLFTRCRESNDTTHWRCYYYRDKCRARADSKCINGETIVRIIYPIHTCAPRN